ncbi:MAG: hypothetical protein JRF60_20180 [Deltaproteobacteria bacterium]|nr:hypothetical protein [Deltaproteobacteria bacterium]
MTVLIIIFGALTLLAGIVIVINPEVIFGFLRNNLDKLIGWLSIVAAIFLSVMGRRNFNRLMSWALSLSKPLGHVGGVLAVAFGAFLIYAFV